jgi:hypothetical protein
MRENTLQGLLKKEKIINTSSHFNLFTFKLCFNLYPQDHLTSNSKKTFYFFEKMAMYYIIYLINLIEIVEVLLSKKDFYLLHCMSGRDNS